MPPSETPEFSFRLQGKVIEYLDSSGRPLWECDLDRIVLLAEFITDDPRQTDHHFLVFWTFEDDELHRALATARAEGASEMLRGVSELWNAGLSLELPADSSAAAGWKSRVLWPPELAGHDYLVEEELPPATWKQKMRRRIAGPIMQWFPTEEVSEYLRRFKPDF